MFEKNPGQPRSWFISSLHTVSAIRGVATGGIMVYIPTQNQST